MSINKRLYTTAHQGRKSPQREEKDNSWMAHKPPSDKPPKTLWPSRIPPEIRQHIISQLSHELLAGNEALLDPDTWQARIKELAVQLAPRSPA